MSRIYNSRISILSANVSATTAAAGYPASNAILQSLGLPWRSTVTTQSDIIVDLGSARLVRGIGLSDINALTGITIASSTDNISYTDRATPTFVADRYGRIRGLVALNTTARYWRIRFASGTPADGAAFWRVGALYFFGGVVDIVAPQYGLRVTTDNAELRERLDNGREAIAALGNRFDRVSGKFGVTTASMVIGTLLADLRIAPIWLDLEVSTRPWWSWPVISDSREDVESMEQSSPDYTEIQLNVKELV